MSGPNQIDVGAIQWEGPEAAKEAHAAGVESRAQSKERRDEAKAAREAQAAAEKTATTAAKAKAGAEAETAKRSGFRDNLLLALQQLDTVQRLASEGTAGYGASLAGLPASKAKALKAAIEAVKGNTFLSSLNAMKDAKTGSTQLGRVLQSEVPFFVDRYGKLDQSLAPNDLITTAGGVANALRRMYARTNGAGPLLDSPDQGVRWRAMQTYGITEPGTERFKIGAPASELLKPGETQTSTPIPPAMQQRYEEYALQHAGKLDPQAYAEFRVNLDHEFGFGAPDETKMDAYRKEAGAINDAAKRGTALDLRIPAPSAEASQYERTRAEAQANPIGGNISAAAAASVPEWLGPMTPRSWEPKLAALREAYPTAAGVGRNLSSLAQLYTAGGVGRVNPEALMAAQGAWSGAGENPDDRLSGAAEGAAIGAGAGLLGRAGGAMARGVSKMDTTLLDKYGVPMTLGDISGGLMRKYVEPTIAKLPVIGAPLRARQQDVLTGFNKAAFDDALAPIRATTGGQIGHEGASEANRLVSDSYTKALQGVRVPTPDDFIAKVDDVLNELGVTDPDVASRLRGKLTPLMQKPVLRGTDLQRVVRHVNDVASGYRDAPGWATSIRPAAEDLRNEVTNLLENNGYAKNAEALSRANQAYRRVGIIQDTINDHVAAGGHPVFTPDTLMRNVAKNVEHYEGRAALSEGDRSRLPLFGIAQEGLNLGMPGKASVAGPVAALAGATAADAGARYLNGGDHADANESGANAVRDAALLGIAGAVPAAMYSRAGRKLLSERLLDRTTGGFLRRTLAKYGPESLAEIGANYARQPERFQPHAAEMGNIAQLPLPVPARPEDQTPEVSPMVFTMPTEAAPDTEEQPQ